MKVIVGIDQSAYWRQVIQNVCDRHWPAATEFKILTVIQPFQWEHCHTPAWEHSAYEIRLARIGAARKLLSDAKALLESKVAGAKVEIELEHGNAGDHIAQSARAWPADKIIVGAHHHSPAGKLGSVPRTLMHNATCSLELVELERLAPESLATPPRVDAVAKVVI